VATGCGGRRAWLGRKRALGRIAKRRRWVGLPAEKEEGLRSWARKEKEGGEKKKKVFKFQNPLKQTNSN
jgi:hypothetical protein